MFRIVKEPNSFYAAVSVSDIICGATITISKSSTTRASVDRQFSPDKLNR
jgi:hypothetical protein